MQFLLMSKKLLGRIRQLNCRTHIDTIYGLILKGFEHLPTDSTDPWNNLYKVFPSRLLLLNHICTYHISCGRFKVMLPLISSPKRRYPRVANEIYKVMTIPMPMFSACGKRVVSFILFSNGSTWKYRENQLHFMSSE